MTRTAEQLLAERTKRIKDAYALGVPDRVPIYLNFGYMLARLGGITYQELERDSETAQALVEEYALHFEPDIVSGLGFSPLPSTTLGDRQTKWAGHGLDPNGTFQFVEGEYMKAEEYDAFLDDATDFTLRTFLPRVYSALEGLAQLPRIPIMLLGYPALPNIGVLDQEEVAGALQALLEASKHITRLRASRKASAERMEALGFPMSLSTRCLVTAPFDFMSDTLRGMRGIMLDMYRCPDKLLAAQEKVLPMLVNYALATARQTGSPHCFIPLHRGSDGFMSLEQFEIFYWPFLKAMLLDMIEGGVTPHVFYEGSYDQRLEYLRELPKGKTIGRFDRSDLFKVKEVLGDTMCIIAGFPVSLLHGGTPAQIRALTKELVDVVGKDGGFIMGPSASMAEADPGLVEVWVQATKQYGVY
ncbi:MAG TPA: uroporphyrinogen decarboxylase family protein, partial [Anaerolineae bacterium]|nr:uroporphyrinogen decarboxylase family protein [Anaerolineae bacterium]